MADNLGGASFKVQADASSFIKSMDDAEKKARQSFRVISKESDDAVAAYELVGAGYELGARKVESALDRQVRAAIEATQSQKAIRQALEETTAAENRMATAANQAATVMAASNARLAASATASTVAVAGAGNASRTSALGFLYLSYAIEDAQYGFSAIVNNIPMIVMAMGGTGGVAGAVSILAVAANIAMNHWEELANAFRSGSEREAAEQMATLADRTEKAAKAFENLKEARTKSEKASGSAFTEGTTDAGGNFSAGIIDAKGGAKDFQKRLSEALLASGQAPSVALTFGEEAKIKASGAAIMFGGGDSEKYIKDQTKQKIDQKKAEALAEKSAALIQRASEGDEAARSSIAAIIKRQPNAFTAEQKKAFEESSPEALRKKADDKENTELQKEAIDKQNKAQEDQGKRDKKLADDKSKADKQARIQALEDQRRDVTERHHQEDLAMQRAKEQLGQGSQRLSGPKAASDYYQKAILDTPLVKLAKEQRDLQEKQRQELVQINRKLEKERAVKPG